MWQVTTPGANESPLNHAGEPLGSAGMGAFSPRKRRVDAIMYMKMQGLIRNSGNLPEIVYR